VTRPIPGSLPIETFQPSISSRIPLYHFRSSPPHSPSCSTRRCRCGRSHNPLRNEIPYGILDEESICTSVCLFSSPPSSPCGSTFLFFSLTRYKKHPSSSAITPASWDFPNVSWELAAFHASYCPRIARSVFPGQSFFCTLGIHRETSPSGYHQQPRLQASLGCHLVIIEFQPPLTCSTRRPDNHWSSGTIVAGP